MIRTMAEHMIAWYNHIKEGEKHISNIRLNPENANILSATATVSDRIILATFTELGVRIYKDKSIPLNHMCFVGNGKVIRLIKLGYLP